jgi:hypothetical protein
MTKIRILDGGCAAWRARYLYVNERKVAHIGIDPTGSHGPQMFGSLLGRSFRFGLPHVRWQYPASPLRMRLYKASSHFWHMMDGRYGWGSAYHAKAKAEARTAAQTASRG